MGKPAAKEVEETSRARAQKNLRSMLGRWVKTTRLSEEEAIGMAVEITKGMKPASATSTVASLRGRFPKLSQIADSDFESAKSIWDRGAQKQLDKIAKTGS